MIFKRNDTLRLFLMLGAPAILGKNNIAFMQGAPHKAS